MKKLVYLWAVLTLVGFTTSGVVYANGQAKQLVSVEQYRAAIQSFGVAADQAEKIAQVTVSNIEKMRFDANKKEAVDAFASVPSDFLDDSSW